MRRNSHLCLGQFLARRYMPGLSGGKLRAFLFGCVEPDHNPFTYCKGSFLCQWLRGHNYPNSRRFMAKLSRRLEQKDRWTLPDYYSLGKLIHYTGDAFTYPHNVHFQGSLSLHREYEEQLQLVFLKQLDSPSLSPIREGQTVMAAISVLHRQYLHHPPSPENDIRFVLTACCTIMATFKEFSPCRSSSTPHRKH